MLPFPKLLRLLVFATATKVLATSLNECALAGPGFPSPSQLSKSPLLNDTITQFINLLQDEQLGLQANDTAWAVALFSSKENKTLYEHYYTPPINVGVSKVDQDSIFRIGSISKVFTVWSFLMEVGDEHFSDPITKYVPELANATYKNGVGHGEVYNDIDNVRWDEVTLGQLASHAAGIPRDPTLNDLSAELDSAQALAFGFPALNKTEIPVCGIPGVNRVCTRSELFTYLLKQRPLYPTAHSPVYSNVAFTLLGYAQQAITGTPVSSAISNNIFEALGMSHSSFNVTPTSGGVIPGGNASAPGVGWSDDLGPISPAGSIYSSASDMVKAGQAILQSTLLSPGRTRRWFKPLIQTGYLSTTVGAPWEIRSLTLPNQRISQISTKQGDEGTYNAALVLSPEHDLGWVVLAAGATSANSPGIREALMNSFGSLFLPMAEQQARNEADTKFAGTFADAATNSSVTILAEPSGGPGLAVTSLISYGAQVIGPESPLIQIYNAGQSARLYPSNLRATSVLKDGSGTYDSRLGFRATYFNATQPNAIQDPCLLAWTALGAPLYGQVALDDWVFEMQEDGQAEFLDVRLLRTRMQRVK
ncbi:beta-lactamase/transpeptidase-like protein [Xylariaceae sp. AK1471]|nr:beta-lactamase/transpeptidase-like protein [Xylariaceae sp. AK1471]